MIRVKSSGSSDKTKSFLDRIRRGAPYDNLETYGQIGVDALASATPRESGETARSWSFKVSRKKGIYSIIWSNSHVVDGSNIAVLIQYGHATGTGGYVMGRDYINPTIRPIFDKIANDIWKKVVTL